MSALQILEINLVSAQDLAPMSKSMHTYAVLWLHRDRKLMTNIDQVGGTNPTWNEKFIFRVDDEFLNADTSAIMIEIYASSWLRDILIGTVGVLINNPLSPLSRSVRKSKMRFVALQIRRPSGRPQGILNVGVTLLDSTMRKMPIYSELSASAVGYRDLMDVKAQKQNSSQSPRTQKVHDQTKKKKQLKRSKSELSDAVSDSYDVKMGYDDYSAPLLREKSENGNKKKLNLNKDAMESSMLLDDWKEEEDKDNSVEGLHSKIKRWRMAFPSEYDQEHEKLRPNQRRKGAGHRRRQSASGGGGLLSCFGNGYKFEFSMTCGGGKRGKRYEKEEVLLSISEIAHNNDAYM